MRNRGYRFIIRDLGFGHGCAVMCINAACINALLKEYGIDPVIFRKLTWEDLAEGLSSDRGRVILEEMRPRNFWQMCDAISLLYTRYYSAEPGMAYKERWFRKYPILVEEDIYEFMLEEGFSQEEALEFTEFCKDHIQDTDKRDLRDMIELYDLPDEMAEVLMDIKLLPTRQRMIEELMAVIVRAVSITRREVNIRESREVY